MFTGIIRELGVVTAINTVEGATVVTIGAAMAATLQPGDSVAVNGACLTALNIGADSWTVRLMEETLKRTNLGNLTVGQPVNVERPLQADQHLDGHFVLGHVDGIARLQEITPVGDDRIFTFAVPATDMRYLIPKGSVALDGVSLTVVEVHADTFTVSLMPYTLDHTTLGTAEVGYAANCEYDVLGKHVERLLAFRPSSELAS